MELRIKIRALFSLLIALSIAAIAKWSVTHALWGFWSACFPLLISAIYYMFKEVHESRSAPVHKKKSPIINFAYFIFYYHLVIFAALILISYYFGIAALLWKTFPPVKMLAAGAEIPPLRGLSGALFILDICFGRFWPLMVLSLINSRLIISGKWDAQRKQRRIFSAFLFKFVPLFVLTLAFHSAAFSFSRNFLACVIVFSILYFPLRISKKDKEYFGYEYF